MMGEHLVVYGTLQTPYPTFARLGLSDLVRVVGRCRFTATLRDLGAYPGVVLDGRGPCHGELVEVLHPRAWAVLDAFEGVEYRRVRITCDDPAATEAWIYEIVTPAGTVVESGVWPARISGGRGSGGG
jgi:gamma-glutamylcyclotransferase (GGCT)/AIG2-like uncharacterized protein YtfP